MQTTKTGRSYKTCCLVWQTTVFLVHLPSWIATGGLREHLFVFMVVDPDVKSSPTFEISSENSLLISYNPLGLICIDIEEFEAYETFELKWMISISASDCWENKPNGSKKKTNNIKFLTILYLLNLNLIIFGQVNTRTNQTL